jgi:hypothetical protein
MAFVFVSAAGADPNSRTMWARVQGKAQNAVFDLFPKGYAFGPGFVRPLHGVASRTTTARSPGCCGPSRR